MSNQALDTHTRLRYLLEENEPAEDPDQFAELVRGNESWVTEVLGTVGLWGDYMYRLNIVESWANGTVMPTPDLRRKTVAEMKRQFSDKAKGG